MADKRIEAAVPGLDLDAEWREAIIGARRRESWPVGRVRWLGKRDGDRIVRARPAGGERWS